MQKVLDIFERYITHALLVIAMFFVLLLTLELVWESYKNVQQRIEITGLNYDPNHSKNLAVLFFNVLLMIEVMGTIKVFDRKPVTKLKIILSVCLIAVARKIMTLDITHSEPLTEIGLAILMLALITGYCFLSWSGGKRKVVKQAQTTEP